MSDFVKSIFKGRKSVNQPPPKRGKGAPPKLELIGVLHNYCPKYINRDLNRIFKKCLKDMLGPITMVDYFRIRLAESVRNVELKGNAYPQAECNAEGHRACEEIIRKASFIKNKKECLRGMGPFYYSKKTWIKFIKMCKLNCTTPKYYHIRWMIDLVKSYKGWRKHKRRFKVGKENESNKS